MKVNFKTAPKHDRGLGHANVTGGSDSCGASHELRFSEFVYDSGGNDWLGLFGWDAGNFSEHLVLHEHVHLFYHNYYSNGFSSYLKGKIKDFLKLRWNTCAADYQKIAQLAKSEVSRLYNASLESKEYKIELAALLKDDTCKDPAAVEMLKLKYWIRANSNASSYYATWRSKLTNQKPACIPLPARFDADFHAHENPNEYFAVALELYYKDKAAFDRSFSPTEKDFIGTLMEHLEDGFQKRKASSKKLITPVPGFSDEEISLINKFAEAYPQQLQ